MHATYNWPCHWHIELAYRPPPGLQVNLRSLLHFAPADRFGIALVGAAVTHTVVILGLSFTSPEVTDNRLPNLDITLVQTKSDKAPRDPQLLAQANQDGGGDTDRDEVATSPLPAQELGDRNNDVPTAQRRQETQTVKMAAVDDYMTQRLAKHKIALSQPQAQQTPTPPQEERAGVVEDPSMSERARLSAEIARSWQEYQKRPRRKFMNARTQEYKYAQYVDAWRAKVERVGNLNYPDQARRAGLAGSLLLDVAINADGSVNSVRVYRSSGNRLLDDAAVRIVELASPFPPFPANIRRESEILHITRTWKFNENRLRTQTD